MKKIILLHLILLLIFAKNISAQSETKIPQDSLPTAVHDELHKQYTAYTVNNIYKVTDKQQNIIYKIEIQKKSKLIDLVYDNQGKIISKEKSKIYSFDGTEKSKSSPTKSNDGHSGHQH